MSSLPRRASFLTNLVDTSFGDRFNDAFSSDEDSLKSDQISDELSTHRPITDRTLGDDETDIPDEGEYMDLEKVGYSDEFISDNMLWRRLTESLSANGFEVKNLVSQLGKQPSIPYATSQALRALIYEMLNRLKDKDESLQQLQEDVKQQTDSLRAELTQTRNCIKLARETERRASHSLTDTEDNASSRHRRGIPDQLRQVKDILGNMGQISANGEGKTRIRHRSGSITMPSRAPSCPCSNSCTFHQGGHSIKLEQPSLLVSKNLKYLQDLSSTLKLLEFQDILPAVQTLQDKVTRNKSDWLKLASVCGSKDSYSDYQTVSTQICKYVESCQHQLSQVQHLRRALKKLGRVVTGGKRGLEPTSKLDSMALFVDSLSKEAQNYSLLRNITEHLKSLFQVTDVNKLFPVINVFYQDFQDLQLLLKNLRQALHLSDAESSMRIQSAVQKLCSLQQETVNSQLRQVLRVNDLQPVLEKLREYDEFLPTFRSLIQQLFDLLGVTAISQIIPAVKRLLRNYDLAYKPQPAQGFDNTNNRL